MTETSKRQVEEANAASDGSLSYWYQFLYFASAVEAAVAKAAAEAEDIAQRAREELAAAQQVF